MVKAVASKATGLCPRRFKSCRCRIFILYFASFFFFFFYIPSPRNLQVTIMSGSSRGSPVSSRQRRKHDIVFFLGGFDLEVAEAVSVDGFGISFERNRGFLLVASSSSMSVLLCALSRSDAPYTTYNVQTKRHTQSDSQSDYAKQTKAKKSRATHKNSQQDSPQSWPRPQSQIAIK